jgi:hypothetical protein
LSTQKTGAEPNANVNEGHLRRVVRLKQQPRANENPAPRMRDAGRNQTQCREVMAKK